MNRFIRFLLSFCMFYAVDPEGAGDDQVQDNAGGEGGETIVESAADAAWDAIQSEEGHEDDQGAGSKVQSEAGQQEEAKKTESEGQKQAEDQKVPDSNKAITEDDLKPLEGAKASTQERFQKITEGYKTEKARADTLAEENTRYKESFDSLRQLGFTDEAAANDLVEFSNYRQVLASGNVEQFQQIMAAQIKQFQELHGKHVHVGASIISDHPDLQQKLENLEIDEQTALEVARARNLQERASRETQRQQEVSQSAQQTQQAIDQAVNQVVALETQWRNNDPDFTAILPALSEAIVDIRRNFHPTQWPVAIEMQYKAIKKAHAASVTQSRQTTPLRGNSHMSGSRQATSLQDAVLQEMGMAD